MHGERPRPALRSNTKRSSLRREFWEVIHTKRGKSYNHLRVHEIGTTCRSPLSFPEGGLLLAPRASKLPYKPLTGCFCYSYIFLIQTEEDCYNDTVYPLY